MKHPQLHTAVCQCPGWLCGLAGRGRAQEAPSAPGTPEPPRDCSRECVSCTRATMDRATRKEDVERAYELQAKAGLAGAARATVLGIGLAVLGHYTWPTFRSVPPSPLRAAALNLAVHWTPTVCLGGKQYRSKASWSPSVCSMLFAPINPRRVSCLAC